MAVLKKIDVPFTQISNDLVEVLDIDELGALVKMLRKPAEWNFNQTNLMDLFGVGKDKLQAICNTLKAVGCLLIEPARSEDGKQLSGYIWTVAAQPAFVDNQDGGFSGSLIIRTAENKGAYKIKNLKNKDSSLIKKERTKKVAHKIPEDFALTASLRAWMDEKTPELDHEAAMADFVNFWIIDGGSKKDWIATFKKAALNYVSWSKCLKQKGDKNDGKKQQHKTGAGGQSNGSGKNISDGAGSSAGKFRANPIILS